MKRWQAFAEAARRNPMYQGYADPVFEAATDAVLPYLWRVIIVSGVLLFARHAVSFF